MSIKITNHLRCPCRGNTSFVHEGSIFTLDPHGKVDISVTVPNIRPADHIPTAALRSPSLPNVWLCIFRDSNGRTGDWPDKTFWPLIDKDTAALHPVSHPTLLVVQMSISCHAAEPDLNFNWKRSCFHYASFV